MDEFLKLNWSTKNLDILEKKAQASFIVENVVTESLIYEYFQDKTIFEKKNKKRTEIFNENEYTPGGGFQLVTFEKSLVDEWVQEHCLKALKLFQSGKDPSCYTTSEQYYIEIFKKYKPKIIEENSKYESFVQNKWNTMDKMYLSKIKLGLTSFGELKFKKRWKKSALYPQFYKEKKLINLSFNENESIIEFKCTSNVLELVRNRV